MSDLHVVILAAGKGTRMKSAWPKVLHKIAGEPMIQYVLDTASRLSPTTTTVVVGHRAEAIRHSLVKRQSVRFVTQEPQLGTAHALLCAESALAGAQGTLILLSGDVPLLSEHSLHALKAAHDTSSAAVTVVTARVDRPSGYGRIVRSNGEMTRIVEQKDATPEEQAIEEINAGIYAFALDGLFDALRGIAAENAQREYYLPDLIALYHGRGKKVGTVTVGNEAEIQGINSRQELARVARGVRDRTNARLMAAGVTIEDPATAYIDERVVIGPDTIIHPGVTLSGSTTIGTGCEIHSGVRLTNVTLGDNVTVLDHCVITDSIVDDDASIGPFAHLRNHSHVGPRGKIGNFVETKKSVLGAGSKSMHLTYLGDAVIGERVNIGAGTITCNYDGVKKQTTTIEDGAFIGSDTQLIAPVTVGRHAYVGTGTTVRENVPSGALAVSAGK